MFDAQAISYLIDLAYQGATRPTTWPEFLQTLADTLQMRSASLVSDLRNDEVNDNIVLNVGTDPKALSDFNEYYWRLDPFRDRDPVEMAARGATQSFDLVDESEFVRSEYYNDYFSRQGWHYGMGVLVQHDPRDGVSALAGMRTRQAGPFASEDLAVLDLLVPHVRRALQLGKRLETFALEHDATAELLDRIAVAVILVDAHGRIVRTNLNADRILSAADGLRSTHDGLRAARSCETAQLRCRIAGAASTTAGKGIDAGGVFALPRPSGGRPYAVMVSPLACNSPFAGSGQAIAAVIVSDGEARALAKADLLRGLYGLTPAEASLAALLAEGRSLQEAANERHVRSETARTQLKRIFAKTGCRRQAELVRLLLTGPAAFGEK